MDKQVELLRFIYLSHFFDQQLESEEDQNSDFEDTQPTMIDLKSQYEYHCPKCKETTVYSHEPSADYPFSRCLTKRCLME